MAYRCLFMDNGIYTAQDVNDALSNLVSEGVSGYPFGNDAVTGLNEAIEGIADSGTQYKGTSCLLVKSGEEYRISEGAAILKDGSQIIFDSEGYVVEHQSGIYEYVYLERDVLHNTVNVVVSSERGGVNTVPIAEIKTDGTVLDRRQFAKAKVSLLAEPKNIGVIKRIQIEVSGNSSYLYDVGFNGWKYIIFRYGESIVGANVVAIELNDNEFTAIFPQNNSSSSSGHIYEGSVHVYRRGPVLEFQNTNSNQWSSTGYDVEVEFR